MPEENIKTPKVFDALELAVQTTINTLFKPFDLAKWFAIGFCAWLAGFSRGGFTFGFPLNFEKSPSLPQQIDLNLPQLGFLGISIIFTIAVMSFGIWLLFLWLSCRGRFMFLDCVAKNRGLIKKQWSQFRQQANSLFLFKLVLTIGLSLFMAVIVLSSLVTADKFNISFSGDTSTSAKIAYAAWVFSVPSCFFIIFLIFFKFINDFVVALMYLHKLSVAAALRKFCGVLVKNKSAFALYLLFLMLINSAVLCILGIFFFFSFCCCCGGFVIVTLLAIPYISTVVLLPLIVFKRAFSLKFLSQLGSEYNVFLLAEEPIEKTDI